MRIPNIDKRDKEDILRQIKSLAQKYVPEWRYDESDPDFGVVLSKIFADMFEDTLSKYNRMSYNNYMSFLNLLGAKLLPPISSEGMVKISPISTSEGAYVDKGTSLYASADNDEGRVFYQTTDGLFVTPTKINSIYMTESDSDRIVNVYDLDTSEDEQIKPFAVYDVVSNQNLQIHMIYFEDRNVFETKNSTELFIDIRNSLSLINDEILPQIFSDKKLARWQYFKDDEWKNIDEIQKTKNGVRLKFDDSIDKCIIMGNESRFVRCVFDKVPDTDIRITDVEYSATSSHLKPDVLMFDNQELQDIDFFPFSEQFISYSDFYISSDEAFSKPGAKVDIEMDMQFIGVKVNTDLVPNDTKYKFIMKEMDFEPKQPSDVEIERVTWEYWNGNGWARLYKDETNEDFFVKKEGQSRNKVLSFICPEDIDKISVGAYSSRYIRARIIKVKNQINVMGNYITPYIHDMSINYNYPSEKRVCKRLYVHSSMKEYIKSLPTNNEKPLLKRIECEYPAIYICLDKPLTKGPIRILLDIEPGIYKNAPSVRWQYFYKDSQGNSGWNNIDAMDLTDNFTHSQVVTIMGKKDFSKTTMFGKEGYFLRVINQDKRYKDIKNIRDNPVLNGIHFNTVQVVQKETIRPEYFFIDHGEENKICQLAHGTVCEARVWVNEIGSLSTNEYELFINDRKKARIEYDSKGVISAIWVEWREVESILSAGMAERAFEIDYNKGQVIFGNGKHGKIPISQPQESIVVEYKTSKGEIGNVDENCVQGFSDSIAYIGKVENLKPIVGGVDMETIDSAASRVACSIGGMGRIVSQDDFESSIIHNDRNIYKVKCISHINEYEDECDGAVSIVVLPKNYMQGYEKFLVIKNRLESFLKDKVPATMIYSSNIRVVEATYVELSINLDIVINDYNMYQKTYQRVYDKLNTFLNPITGNFDGKGWDIGQIPRKELIYNYIKNTEDIKWIKSINVFARVITPEGKKDIDYEQIKGRKFIVPVFGEPEINMYVE